MDLKLQHIILGTIQSNRYSFDKKKNALMNVRLKQPMKPTNNNGIMSYRFALGYSHKVTAPLDECIYLFHFGIFNPNAKVIHKDGDPLNNSIDNLTLDIEGDEIPNDIKEKIIKLFAEGKGYAEIGRILNVNRSSTKRIVINHYGSVHPRQYCSTKSLVDSMRRDTNGYRIR